MGAPRIWYYPERRSTLESIDLAAVAASYTQIDADPVFVRADGVSQTGHRSTSVVSSRLRVRLQLKRFDGQSNAARRSIVDDLMTLRNHLRRGGQVIIAEDSDRTWAAAVRNAPRRGATTINVGSGIFGSTLTSGGSIPSAGDRLLFQAPWPDPKREWATVDSYTTTGRRLALTHALRYHQDAAQTIVTHRGFYPCLQLPAESLSSPMLTQERRLAWTLDVTLEQSPPAIAELATYEDTAWSTETSAAGVTLWDLAHRRPSTPVGSETVGDWGRV